ncbi:MAG: putative PBS lyase HEAT-like repeat protein [Promethearchaeota archaeon]|nr:MAG: putative PBS lyase HEAT-like repeat protein [Candidatus Lokiarchaeota archaeon]
MKEFNLAPREIFEKRNELGVSNSIKTLLEIIEFSDTDLVRKEALQTLRSFDDMPESLKMQCFGSLENVIISEKNIALKCEAGKTIGKLKIEKGLEPLKWLLDQQNLGYEDIKIVLKAIHDCKFEKEEIELFLSYIDSKYTTIKEYVKNTLLTLTPETAIKIFLDYLGKNPSNEAKKELIKLVGYEITGLNVSFDDFSYLKSKYPDVLSLLIEKIDELTDVLSILKEEDTLLLENLIIIFNVLEGHINNKLIELLDDEDFIAKESAIRLIGRLRIKEASDKLVENIDNVYNDVSLASIEALGEIGDISLIPDLIKALDIEDASFEYADYTLKWNIIESIKKIYLNNEKVSYGFLIERLSTSNDILKESVAYILGEIASEEFTEPLLNTLKEWHNIDVAKSIIIALGKIGELSATKRFLKILNDQNTYWLLKKVTVDSLFNIFKKNWHYMNTNEVEEKRTLVKRRSELEEYLTTHPNDDKKVKVAIIKFLERFGDKTSINTLMKRLNDFPRIVQISASKAIKKIEKRFETETE